MGNKREYDYDGTPAFKVKSLGHVYKVKRSFRGKGQNGYVVATFGIDAEGNVTILDSDQQGADFKEFIFAGSDPHVIYKIGTMLRDIGSFGIKQKKKIVKKVIVQDGSVDKKTNKESS